MCEHGDVSLVNARARVAAPNANVVGAPLENNSARPYHHPFIRPHRCLSDAQHIHIAYIPHSARRDETTSDLRASDSCITPSCIRCDRGRGAVVRSGRVIEVDAVVAMRSRRAPLLQRVGGGGARGRPSSNAFAHTRCALRAARCPLPTPPKNDRPLTKTKQTKTTHHHPPEKKQAGAMRRGS